MKWKSTCCLQISSVLKWIFAIMNVVFLSFTNISTFFEWLFREQKHLKRENDMKWKSTCCLQISSVVKRSSSIMNVVFSEIWNVYSNQIKSNQIKSNQIKSYFPISHAPYSREYSPYIFPKCAQVKEDLNNHYHNTIHISFHFNLLFMINVLS